jgi:hypothetical protein
MNNPEPQSSLILYQTEDGRTRIQCRFENETVWLTQALMAELFQIGVNTVNHHLKEIYDQGELPREATIRQYRIVRSEGRREVAREIEHYSLPAILAVGYRVRSHRGTQFRQWATARLSEEELQTLNRIVNLYIEFAELQTLERRPMTMRGWIAKLDEFLKISGRELLDHAGRISAETAKAKAELEYRQYHAFLDSQPRQVDADFEAVVKQLPKPARPSKPDKKGAL